MKHWNRTRWLHPDADAGGGAATIGEAAQSGQDGGTPSATDDAAAQGGTPSSPAGADKDAVIRELTEKLNMQQEKLNVQDRALAEKMNAEERLSLELQQRQAAVEASESALALEKRARFATDAVTAAGLLDDPGDATRWADYVLGEDDKATSERAAGLKQKFDRAVQEAMKRRFAEIGGAPESGGDVKEPEESAAETLAKDLAQKTGTKTARDIRAHYIQ